MAGLHSEMNVNEHRAATSCCPLQEKSSLVHKKMLCDLTDSTSIKSILAPNYDAKNLKYFIMSFQEI